MQNCIPLRILAHMALNRLHPVSGIIKRPPFIALLTPSAACMELRHAFLYLSSLKSSKMRGILISNRLKSKADGTAKKYVKGFNTWRKWASQFKEIVIFLASSVHV